MNKLLISTFLLLLVTSPIAAQERGLGVSASSDERRIALVIGNGAYPNSPLLNPTNDAKDIAKALAEYGFEVIYKENLTQNEMKKVIRDFGQRIRKGGVGLFYYAGHGIQVSGQNFLVPIGATITLETEVEYEAVNVGLVLAQMESAENRLNIVILDACRNNPFARSFRSTREGLASIDAPSGTLIAYATAPGKVASDGEGKNGLYTLELLNVMRIPDLKIEEVFKRTRIAVQKKSGNRQIPWESSSLVGDFYFLRQSEIIAKEPPKTSSTGDDIKLVKPDTSQQANQGAGPIENKVAISQPTAKSDTDPPLRKRDVEVFANRDWTSSGIIVERGGRIRITANGTINLDQQGQESTPAGFKSSDPGKLLQSKPTGCLIAVIGADNDDFIFIGSSAEFEAKRSGLIFLSINEGVLRDNSGTYKAIVEVWSPKNKK